MPPGSTGDRPWRGHSSPAWSVAVGYTTRQEDGPACRPPGGLRLSKNARRELPNAFFPFPDRRFHHPGGLLVFPNAFFVFPRGHPRIPGLFLSSRIEILSSRAVLLASQPPILRFR